MPCKIQIRKNINAEVEVRTDPGFNRSLPAARGIADAVNKDFGFKVVSFSENSAREITRDINIPNELVDKYYGHELKLEEREAANVQKQDAKRAGIDYTDNYLFQKQGTKGSTASAATVKMVKDFLARIGVDINEVDDIIMGGVKINANGVALLTQKLVQVVRGQEATALTEEAMHFAVEILEQKDPALFNKLLSEIGKYNIYNDVFNLYSQDVNYQTKDGKPNIRKIKKEAIGKLLAEMVIEKNEGLTEKPELLAKSESWFEQILNALRSIFSKSGFDEAAMKILSGEAIGTADDIRAEEQDIYLQKNDDVQSVVFDKLKSVQNTISLTADGYFIDGKKVPTRVSDLVGQWYERRFKANDITKDEFSTAIDDTKAEKGTAGHKDLEEAFKLFVDEDGYLRDEALDDSDYVSQINPKNRDMYELLRDNLKERLNSFPAGTRFMSEVRVYDPKRGLAGTIDFLAIDKEGTTSILDWKFTDINIEKEGDQTDVPWYKISAWNQQMDQYKLILKNAYGVKDGKFGQTRMIPIKAHYSFVDYKNQILPELIDIEIGDVDVQNIKQDYLIPVGLQEETTGNDEIDALLVKLNAEYKKISESKVLPSEKLNKAEQLNALFKAIRQLQMKQNIRPLVNQARILNKQIQSTIDKYDSKFKGVDPKSFDDDQREGIFNDYADELETAKATLDIYTSLDTELEFLLVDATTEEDKQLREDLRQAASKARALRANLTTTSNNFIDYVAKAEGTTGVLNAEKIIKGFSKFFSSTSTIQMKTMEVLFKKANRALGFAAFDTLDETKRLEKIKSNFDTWAKAKGLNAKNYFNILKKADKNELINEFDTEFYKKLKEVTGKKGVGYAWVKDNVDIEAYKESLKDKIAEEYQRIEDKNRLGTEEEIERDIKREKAQVDKLYSVSTTEGAGWYQYDLLKKHPIRDKWETAEWKELNAKGNEPAKAFYDYIIERNDYYKSIGYINSKEARVFLPFVRKTLLEKIQFGGDITVGEQFFRAISVDEGDVGFGQTDPLTGQPIDTIPTYFTKDIGGDVSTDLFRTMALYNEMALRYKYLSEIEGQARLLLSTERNKKAIATSLFGKTLYDNGKLQYTPNNTDNSQLLQSMIKGIIYGQKYLENDTFDMLLGKLGDFGERANKKMGMKIFPEGLSQRQISVNKVLDTLNNQFQLNAMGLNVLSAGSNLFGGTAQSIINSGKYFTKADYASTSLWLLSNKMKGVFGVKGADKIKAIAALEYFLPLTDNYNKEIAKKLSISSLTQENLQEFLMVLMRNSDLAVQTTNFYSFLKNSIVIDGQVINARQYLRNTDKYAKMYEGTNAEQRKQLDADFETEVKDLVDEKGVLALSSVEDGKLVIPGVDRKSESVIDLRRKVQALTKDALGNLSDDDMRLINMNIYGKSMMMFHNWIPRLADVRFGNLKYNSASDAYEWGRTRTVFRIMSQDVLRSIGNLRGALIGSDKGIDNLRQLFEQKKADYETDTGKELDMTEAEFINLVRQNIKSSLYDVIALATMYALYMSLKAMAPDDDEENPAVRNRWKFYLKATDKFKDELSYFYDPTSISGLVSTSAFPAIKLLDNYEKVVANFLTEMYAISIDDKELADKNYVIKYLMSSFPMAAQAKGYLPMFFPELAKDLGIKAQAEGGFIR